MKKLALVIAAAAAMFAVSAPASAQGMHRDGMRHGGMHRGGHHMGRPHMGRSHAHRSPRIVVMPRRHSRRGHHMH
jgi:hypothetical protein